MCENIARKKLTKKKLWTFEWPKMNHIFISPYNMYIKNCLECLFFIWIF